MVPKPNLKNLSYCQYFFFIYELNLSSDFFCCHIKYYVKIRFKYVCSIHQQNRWVNV